jgi:hypothetical protein
LSDKLLLGDSDTPASPRNENQPKHTKPSAG